MSPSSLTRPKQLDPEVKWAGTWTLLTTAELAEVGLSEWARRVAQELESSRIHSKKPFCLWLLGEVGAGKTTFCKPLFTELGVDRNIAVTSPTYTYLAEYKTQNGMWLAHLDLYRSDLGLDIEDLVAEDFRSYGGYVLEWPERMEESSKRLPTHLLEIETTDLGRRYSFWSYKVLSAPGK